MDIADISPQLDQLDDDVDRLEEALQPLLTDLGDVSSRLPLLDKAKLDVLAAYAIESTLFSALRLSGVEAKDHAVFKELARVRQYFGKIHKVENPPEPRDKSVNTTAAIRFLKADLADNAQVKKGLSEQLAKEEAKTAKKAEEAAEKAKKKAEKAAKKKRKAEEEAPGSSQSSDAGSQQSAKPSKKPKQ